MPRELTEADWERYALEWMGEWGWTYVPGAALAPTAGSERRERESWDDLVLVDRLREAIERINPGLPTNVVDEVMAQVRRRESGDTLAENFRIHQLLTRGVRVGYTDHDGTEHNPTVWFVDFNDQYANDFVVANQLLFRSSGGQDCRFDMVGYVNGLPLAIFELKKADDEAADSNTAYRQLRTYLRNLGVAAFAIPAIAVASDGITAVVGTPFSEWEHFAPWSVDEWGSPTSIVEGSALEVLITGVFEPARFLDLIANFIEFSAQGAGGVNTKKLARAHQYFAVNKAVDATVRAVGNDGRAGVVWHTQGAGKSLEMAFYTAKLMRHESLRNPTIVVLTDRLELDDQLYQNFSSSRLLERPVQMTDRAEVRDEFARDTGGIIFSTLHKFSRSDEEKYAQRDHAVLSSRKNIVVIADEAHRSHYDFIDGFARNLRDALPNATFVAFTGTPIATAERNTRAVFGDYIDIYDLSRAVSDGVTVRVFYENRHIPVKLPEDLDPDYLDARADDAIAELPTDERNKVQRAVRMTEQVVGAPERLAKVAEDLVAHWERRREEMVKQIGGPGKAMIVCLRREICARLYEEIVRIRGEWADPADDKGRIKVLFTGTPSDDEVIAKHVRSEGRNKAIQQRVKKSDDELEIIMVASKLLTGFDAPPLHTLYLDKPMTGAALMQAIARVNRTFRDKYAGLVVDYIGVTERLSEALADYTHKDQRERPIGKDVSEAIEIVREQHERICEILEGYDWRTVLFSGSSTARLDATYGVVDYLRDPVRAENLRGKGELDLAQRFGAAARGLMRAFALCAAQSEVQRYRDDIGFFDSIRIWMAKFDAEERSARGLPNPPEIELALQQLASSSVGAGEAVDIFAAAGLENPDLTHVDEAFIEQVRASSRPNLAIEALRRMLEREIRNTHRHNVVAQRTFSDRLLEAMRRYTNNAISSAEVITALFDLAQEVHADKDRARRLGLDEKELAFYDAVATNESAVRQLGNDVLANIARELVRSIRNDVSVDWTIREQVQAKLRSKVKRLLARFGYPPDAEPQAVQLVLDQTKTYAEDWAVERFRQES